MSHRRYQVAAECAHVPVTDHSGVRSTHLLYKGAFLPDDVDADRLGFLLDGGFVVEEGDVPIAPNASVEQDPRTGVDSVSTARLQGQSDAGIEASRKADEADAAKAQADAEVAEKRAAAKAKLPADGSAPHANAGQQVWVEYHVAQGGNYDDLAKQDKADLIELAKSRQS